MDILARRFVVEYVRSPGDLDGICKRLGISKSKARTLLADSAVDAAIRLREHEVSEAALLDSKWVLQQWYRIATADPSQLVRVVRKPCPDCHTFDTPLPDCPVCNGEGVAGVDITPTDEMNDDALALFDGAEQTRTGIKITMRNRDKALDNIARYVGALVERSDVNIRGADVKDLTDEQLLALIEHERSD